MPEPPARLVRAVPMSGEVTVPDRFIGMHLHRWPDGPSPAPTFPFGTARSLNYDPQAIGGAMHWNGIERENGRFDWKAADRWVETHHGAGRDLMFTFYGTPAWCASSTARDSYGLQGGNTNPRDLRYVARFIRALVDRYNGGGTRKIKYLEIWNEPSFDGKQTWKGSAQELAALGRTVFIAAKGIDPGIKVLWPAFIDSLENGQTIPNLFKYSHQAYAAAQDGAGGTGRDWADALNFHYYYSHKVPGVANMMDYQDSMLAVRKSLERQHWDIYLTEVGFLDGVGERFETAQKIDLIRRWIACSAAYGNRMIGLYSYESDTNLGAPATNPAISRAIAQMHDQVCGKRIRRAGMLEDGSFWLAFADGAQLRC